MWRKLFNGSPQLACCYKQVQDERLLNNKTTEKQWTKCQRFVKLKELQADSQAKACAAHLILPNSTHVNNFYYI